MSGIQKIQKDLQHQQPEGLNKKITRILQKAQRLRLQTYLNHRSHSMQIQLKN